MRSLSHTLGAQFLIRHHVQSIIIIYPHFSIQMCTGHTCTQTFYRFYSLPHTHASMKIETDARMLYISSEDWLFDKLNIEYHHARYYPSLVRTGNWPGFNATIDCVREGEGMPISCECCCFKNVTTNFASSLRPPMSSRHQTGAVFTYRPRSNKTGRAYHYNVKRG